MSLPEWKPSHFVPNFLESIPKGMINTILIQIMARLTGKTVSEQIMTLFTNAYIRHSVAIDERLFENPLTT